MRREPSSGEITVKSGSTVSLKCAATGYPKPQVSFPALCTHHTAESSRYLVEKSLRLFFDGGKERGEEEGAALSLARLFQLEEQEMTSGDGRSLADLFNLPNSSGKSNYHSVFSINKNKVGLCSASLQFAFHFAQIQQSIQAWSQESEASWWD